MKYMGNGTVIDDQIYDISRRFQNAGSPISCAWNNKHFMCANHSHFSLTDNGLCFTFNSMDPQDIYSEELVVYSGSYSEYSFNDFGFFSVWQVLHQYLRC